MVYKSQWGSLIQLLSKYLDEAAIGAEEGGRYMTLEEHNAYYRAMFDRLREELRLRVDIPNAVMEEPTKELTLTFYGRWNEPVCLGCLDFHDTSDIIHVELHAEEDEPDGVTKDDLVRCICEVICGGIHVYSESNEETGVILSNFDWMGTTALCNLEDSILYIGYKLVAKAPSAEAQHEREEGGSNFHGERFEVTLDLEALGPGTLAYQGYNEEYARKLMVLKGWNPEDLDL
ncbi:hypothetical protein F5B19DRAFT_491798 [Rostrohypoxylon terebratum]|nr:hypothetical protein F5B19DRAFT_491798 [Rostrohypoxylon terebratum]